VLIGSPSWAATIEPGQGDLSVNQGQGFKPVNSRVDANVGDSVMVGPGGGATIVYDDGCKVDVQPGAVATISSLSPCASGSNAEDVNWAGIVWGAAVVGVSVGGVLAATNNSSNNTLLPTSP
jgi:hypothetical protein